MLSIKRLVPDRTGTTFLEMTCQSLLCLRNLAGGVAGDKANWMFFPVRYHHSPESVGREDQRWIVWINHNWFYLNHTNCKMASSVMMDSLFVGPLQLLWIPDRMWIECLAIHDVNVVTHECSHQQSAVHTGCPLIDGVNLRCRKAICCEAPAKNSGDFHCPCNGFKRQQPVTPSTNRWHLCQGAIRPYRHRQSEPTGNWTWLLLLLVRKPENGRWAAITLCTDRRKIEQQLTTLPTIRQFIVVIIKDFAQ